MYSMWWVQHRPHLTVSRLLWYDMRPSGNEKVCTTRGMYSFYIAFRHRSHNVVCFVLPPCCTAADSDPIALVPNSFVQCLVTCVSSSHSTALSTRRHPAHLSLARLITVADTAESPAAAAAAGGGRSILIYTCFRRQRLGLTLASFFFFFF